MNLDALVAPLRADVVSGASTIGRTAADVVRRAIRDIHCDDVASFRTMLFALSTRILEAQPAMAPLVTLASRVLLAVSHQDDLSQARVRARETAESFRSDLDQATQGVASQAGALLPPGATVLTLSSSSTVRAALEKFGGARSLEIICLESRPMNEGVHLARSLSRWGGRVRLAVDAAAGTLMGEADLVLLGADSFGDHGLVNKIGSLALVSLAKDRGIPVHVLLDQSKLLPPGYPQSVADDRPGNEVLKGFGTIQVWNRYFELIPAGSIASIVTERGRLSPSEVQVFRSRIPVPAELLAWANARSQ